MGAEDDFMGGGSKTFPFEHPGDTVTGIILDITQRQQTDMDTGAPSFWPDGKPKMMFTIELQTKIREDADDDGVRVINVRWKSLQAVQKAVKAAGAKKPERGGELSMRFTSEDPVTKRGFNAPRNWDAHYVPPDASTSFMSEQAPAQAPLGARDGVRQARNVDHQGQPQSQEAPAWAQPQAALTETQSAAMERLRRSQEHGQSRLSTVAEDERQKFGY